jgi:hypothetical protein
MPFTKCEGVSGKKVADKSTAASHQRLEKTDPCPSPPRRRQGRKSGAYERRTRLCNRRKKERSLTGPPPLPLTVSEKPPQEASKTVLQPPLREESATQHPAADSLNAPLLASSPAEFFRLSEQLATALLEIEALQSQLQDLVQSSQSAQVKAYSDGFTTGLTVAEQTVAMALSAVASRDGQLADLQAQLTATRDEAASQIAELQAQVTMSCAAATSQAESYDRQVADLRAQLSTARAVRAEADLGNRPIGHLQAPVQATRTATAQAELGDRLVGLPHVQPPASKAGSSSAPMAESNDRRVAELQAQLEKMRKEHKIALEKAYLRFQRQLLKKAARLGHQGEMRGFHLSLALASLFDDPVGEADD